MPIKPGRQSPYAKFGFSKELQKKIEEVKLPPTLRCKQCHHDLPTTMFSNRQVGILREDIFMEGEEVLHNDESQITCASCTFREKSETRCAHCDQMMSIEYFAKTQRNLENPICRRCRWHIDNESEQQSQNSIEDVTAQAETLVLEKSKHGWVRMRKSEGRNAAESQRDRMAMYGPPCFVSDRAVGLLPNIPPPGNTGYPADASGYMNFMDTQSVTSGRESDWEGSGGDEA